MMDKVLVGVRCRPLSASEKNEPVIDYFQDNVVCTPRNKYPFDFIFPPDTSQYEIYSRMVRPVVRRTLEGYNATILAYGQTGTGKTYTMGLEINSPTGIVERVLEEIFNAEGVSVFLSFIELYIDEIYDLLSSKPTKVSVSGFKAVEAVKQQVFSLQSAMDILQNAVKNRKVGSTNSNTKSSRSHAILTISVVNNQTNRLSKVSLVDLAGSERIEETEKSRRAEGLAINCSLLHLLRTVTCLSNGASHIPYRDSKLTSLLRDTLNFNNFIGLIACFNPKKTDVEETEKTLAFASKFAGIDCIPEISSQVLSTPFKTPRSMIKNQTFSGFGSKSANKQVLKPHNRTIDTPSKWDMKRSQENLLSPKRAKLAPDSANSFRESSETLWNPLETSSSTTFSDFKSPIEENEAESSIVPCTPVSMSHVHEIIQAAVEATVKATEKRVKAALQEHLSELSVKKDICESWSARIARVRSSLNISPSFQDSGSDSDEEVNAFCSTLDQTVVVPEPNITPKARDPDLTGPGIYGENSVKTPTNKPVGTRRSMRLSLKTQPPAESPASFRRRSKVTDWASSHCQIKGSGIHVEETEIREPTNKPAGPRRSMRLSLKIQPPSNPTSFSRRSEVTNRALPSCQVKVSRVDADLAQPRRRSMRLSTKAPSPKGEKKKNHKDKRKTIKTSRQLTHEESVLQILQEGDLKELQKLPTIGPKTALLIINHRLLYGPLGDVQEFNKVKGLTKNQAARFLWANSLE